MNDPFEKGRALFYTKQMLCQYQKKHNKLKLLNNKNFVH